MGRILFAFITLVYTILFFWIFVRGTDFRIIKGKDGLKFHFDYEAGKAIGFIFLLFGIITFTIFLKIIL